jgi:N-acetylglucosaminylphosphatidylinositol deacetylase
MLIPVEFQHSSYRLLLVVAHPDDECLFFAPTLRVLRRQFAANLSLLVFSRGNHKGLGQIRANELSRSCSTLEIPQERCISLDLLNIQDNPEVWWPEQQLIPIIDEYIRLWSIDLLVSFDQHGISGHINHRALASAVRVVTKTNNSTRIKMSYELTSVGVIRKYSSIIDFYLIFISWIPRMMHSLLSFLVPFKIIPSIDASSLLLINTPHDYVVARQAFAHHPSQYSWDRYLYLITSRYMFVNELRYIDKH